MPTRVLVTLQPDASVQQVVHDLTALGAVEVQPPQSELPDVCVATVDEQQHAPDAWAAAAQQIAGVTAAEVDQLRWSM
jgi:hypothetical protein